MNVRIADCPPACHFDFLPIWLFYFCHPINLGFIKFF